MQINPLNFNFSKTKTDQTAKIKHRIIAKGPAIGYFVARVDNFVQAHFHKKGDEVYHILKGQGLIHLGKPLIKDIVRWQKPQKVKKDDIVVVSAGQAHYLKNTGRQPLVLGFICPHLHLSKDRIVLQNPK